MVEGPNTIRMRREIPTPETRRGILVGKKVDLTRDNLIVQDVKLQPDGELEVYAGVENLTPLTWVFTASELGNYNIYVLAESETKSLRIREGLEIFLGLEPNNEKAREASPEEIYDGPVLLPFKPKS